MGKKLAPPAATLGASEDAKQPASMHLHDHHLDQLGMKKLPGVGDVVPMMVHGRVTSVSDHGDGGGRHVSMDLDKMVVKAKQRAAREGHIEEGNLEGAKAAMDQALDSEEMSKSANKKHGKAVGRKPM